MKKDFQTITRKWILIGFLVFFFGIICLLNFSAAPSFYDADMYCDYQYAMETWKHKSIFPDGWVFGNQLNAVSTPVLAALFFGLSNHINFSMAAACTVMAILVMLSFDWMTRVFIKEPEGRLFAGVLFMTITLYCGNAVLGNQGWTLFFTMCSYYAGYSITAFLAFGSYLRSFNGFTRKQYGILILTCILSFGTGIQSIRQTVIMIAPILALEFLRMALNIQCWKKNKKPLAVAMALAVSNFLGLFYVALRPINRNQVFGTIKITPLSELEWQFTECFSLIEDLLKANKPEDSLVLTVMMALCVGSLFVLLRNAKKKRDLNMLALPLLFGISVMAIAFIDVATTMYIRPRYYFMYYPLLSLLCAYLYDNLRHRMKWVLLALAVVFSWVAGSHNLSGPCQTAINREQEECYEISQYLLDNGYTTIYGRWWNGQNVAVASDGRLSVGYWYTEEEPFDKVTYLCNPEIYNADPEQCVYLFAGKQVADIGVSAAQSMDVPLQLLRYYPESDIYLYTAEANLMQINR